MMQRLIYVVEDDENIRTLIRMALISFSYQVRDFSSAEQALQAITTQLPDLIILDVMLPGMSGLEATKQLRQTSKTQHLPVVLLTAKNTEIDKVAGLDCGADDYIAKPFGVMELGARLRSLFRRVQQGEQAQDSVIQSRDLSLNLQTRELRKKNKIIPLTYKEFELLWLLLTQECRVIPREELFLAVWGIDFEGESRTLDMHIRTLRQKLGQSPTGQPYIKTLRGVGYRFMASASQ